MRPTVPSGFLFAFAAIALAAGGARARAQEAVAPGLPDTLPDSVAGLGVADTDDTGTLPPLTTALSEKAARAIAQADWETARDAYQKMLAEAPDNALTLANLGVVEFQLRSLDAAREHLERAVRLRPALSRAWTTLGLIYLDLGQPLLAVSALTRALHDEPGEAAAHNYLAVAAKELGWNTAAELELQRAIDLQPTYSEAHFNLSLIYLERHPPATELARRHYYLALDLGATPDPLVEEQLAQEPPATP